LLWDNGLGCGSEQSKNYLVTQGITQTYGAPYYSITQGKIEQEHRSMKDEVNLQKYYRRALGTKKEFE
jgi:hypothetical protein